MHSVGCVSAHALVLLCAGMVSKPGWPPYPYTVDQCDDPRSDSSITSSGGSGQGTAYYPGEMVLSRYSDHRGECGGLFVPEGAMCDIILSGQYDAIFLTAAHMSCHEFGSDGGGVSKKVIGQSI